MIINRIVINKRNTSTGKWETFIPDIYGFRIATFYSDTYSEALEVTRKIRSGEIEIKRNHESFEYKPKEK